MRKIVFLTIIFLSFSSNCDCIHPGWAGRTVNITVGRSAEKNNCVLAFIPTGFNILTCFNGRPAIMVGFRSLDTAPHAYSLQPFVMTGACHNITPCAWLQSDIPSSGNSVGLCKEQNNCGGVLIKASKSSNRFYIMLPDQLPPFGPPCRIYATVNVKGTQPWDSWIIAGYIYVMID